MYFLLYWIQNLRMAEPRGPQRPADPTLSFSRWWNWSPEKGGACPGSVLLVPRPALFPCSSVDHPGSSSRAWRWPIRDRNPCTSLCLAELKRTSPQWHQSVLLRNYVMISSDTHRKGYNKAAATWHKTPSLTKIVWLVFTLNVKWWSLSTITYFFKITPKELHDNLASISNLCYLTYFSSYNSLCDRFYMDRSMVIGKLQYVWVQIF